MARVRKQPGTREALIAYSPMVVLAPHLQRGRWHEQFGNNHPIQMEVGMGRGTFISTKARENPHLNFIGVEVVEEILLYAVKKIQKNGGIPPNLSLVWINAGQLEELFAPEEIARIYLNFSDPWPKNRHAKRRLTHQNFLAQYENILVSQGEVHFKTDNQGLFEFSLNEFSDSGWRLRNIQLDMYQDLPEGNVATEYEKKFHQQGLPIYRLEAVKSQ